MRSVPASTRRWRRLLLVVTATLDLPPDWLAPVVSLVAGSNLAFGSPWLGLLVFWLAFYEVAPLVYRVMPLLPARRPGFRLLFATGSLGTLRAFVSPVDPFLLAVSLVALGVGLTAYLVVGHGWDLRDPNGSAVATATRFGGEPLRRDVQRDLRASGVYGAVGLSVWVVAFTTIVVFPSAVVGILGAMIARAYPLFDVVVLVTVIFCAAIGDCASLTDVATLDTTVFAQASTALRGITGMFSGLVLALGLFLSVAQTVGALGAAVIRLGGVGSLVLAPDALATPWAVVGAFVCLTGSGVLTTWAWIRLGQRLPSYLRYRRGDPPSMAPPTPVFSTAPAMLLFVAGAAGLTTARSGLDPFVAWPLLLLIPALAVRATQRRDPTLAVDTYRSLVVSLVVQLAGLWTGFGVALGFRSVLPQGVFLVGLVVLVSVVPGAIRFERDADGLGRYALSGLLCVLAAWFLLGAWFGFPLPSLVTVAGAAVCAGGALALAITTRLSL